MKTRTKITIISIVIFVAVLVVIFSIGYIQDVQRQEFFSKWREMRESWMNSKHSDTQSFSGINCSVLGIANLDCFFDAYNSCSLAIIEQIHTTVEGDPVSIMARINSDCNVDVMYDSTMDRYSNQEIKEYVCHSVTLKENSLEFKMCSDGVSEEEHGFSIQK